MMTELLITLEAFHFIRPVVLLLLLPVIVLWWLARRRMIGGDLGTDSISSHLRDALTVGREARRRIQPIDGTALILCLAVLGAAGPTWSRVPDPFVSQTAPMVIALKVTPSMEQTDVLPSRLERGKQKIRDLLDLRAGARTALVAYSGTAHSVVPMTDDPSVMQPYLEGLSPDVMPEEGDNATAALTLAQGIIAKEDAPGGILFIADALGTADLGAFNTEHLAPIAFLSMLPEGVGDAGLDALDLTVVPVTPDDSDVRRLDQQLNAAYRRALAQDGDQPWDDRGWILAWPAALLTLIWFRRGWTMRWSAALVASLSMTAAPPARADGIADWFFTPDQQGRLAFEDRDFEKAAEAFVDPMWKGYALYRDGQYEAASELLSRLKTPDAAFVEGMARIKNRDYRGAIDAFQTTLDRDPDFPGAADNLDLARQILDYVEEAREQSDTGEDQGIGADEVVFDNKDAGGQDTQIDAQEGADGGLLTADQWMNTVDTNTGDFLRQRFAIEAAQSQ